MGEPQEQVRANNTDENNSNSKKIELIKAENDNGVILDVDGVALFNEISTLIERNRRVIFAQANSTNVLHFWEIGKTVNKNILKNKRADHGKKVVPNVAIRLVEKYGRNYEEKIYGVCSNLPSSLPMRKLSLRCHDN